MSSQSDQYIDPDGLDADAQRRLEAATFNDEFVNVDASRGVHNPEYTRQSLSIAEGIVADLGPKQASF